MAKNIVSRIDRNLARRLREARREVGLSTRAVVKKLPRRTTISHATLAAYEKGVAVPQINVLGALASVYQRPLNWFLDSRGTLSGFRYRNLQSRVALSDQRRYAAVAGKWADAYLNLERHLKPFRESRDLSEFGGLSAAELAGAVRQQMLNLDDGQPVQSTIFALESLSAWAIELRASFAVDGAVAKCGDEPVVFFNPAITNERLRMNAAHEIAYVLFEDIGFAGAGEADLDRQAYDFACSLLMPDAQLRAAFEGRSFLRLIEYKERFGVSLAAMIYRAEKLRIINTTASRWLWSEMGKRGWRHSEPGYVWRDRAIGFEIMLESAIENKAPYLGGRRTNYRGAPGGTTEASDGCDSAGPPRRTTTAIGNSAIFWNGGECINGSGPLSRLV